MKNKRQAEKKGFQGRSRKIKRQVKKERFQGRSSEIKTYTCRYCGERPFTLPKLGTHSKTCSERLKAIAKVKRKPEGEGEVRPLEVAEARQVVAQFGREGLNKIKRERLRSVLDMAVSKKRFLGFFTSGT